jgi:hypothetical protein
MRALGCTITLFATQGARKEDLTSLNAVWETQSILGLIKPCLEKAAAGRLWAEEGREKGGGCQRCAPGPEIGFFFLFVS